MSEFKPLEPRNLGHFTDVEVKNVYKCFHCGYLYKPSDDRCKNCLAFETTKVKVKTP